MPCPMHRSRCRVHRSRYLSRDLAGLIFLALFLGQQCACFTMGFQHSSALGEVERHNPRNLELALISEILSATETPSIAFRRSGEVADVNSTHLDLLWIGGVFGVLHVLTGPDHVSAMVTLAAGRGAQAFWLGARWGAGHSFGLVIMYIALLAAGEGVLDSADVADKIVGFVMILLGCVGIVAAFRDHREEIDSTEEGATRGEKEVPMHDVKIDQSDLQPHHEAGGCRAVDRESLLQPDHSPLPTASAMGEEIGMGSSKEQLGLESDRGDAGCCSKERLLSVFVGIIHGMAGPGGVLGVLPAVHQKDLRRGIVYLGAFSLATIAGMAVFAAGWGQLTGVARPGSRVKLWLRVLSAALSVVVGVLWVTLAFMGRLGELMGE